MASRILAVVVVGVVVVGLAGDGWAQKGTASRRKSRPMSTTAVAAPQQSAEPGGGSRTGSAGSSGTQDPFDAAAAKLRTSQGKAGASEGHDGSTGKTKSKLERATFGAGCFWCTEAAFEWLPGVKSAVSGYAGGWVSNPDYEMVHSGLTGHAEVVQVTYDPSVISYEQLLKVFWTHHDPTQLNRQGPDVGTQYRSVIFYHTPAQREAALKSYRELTAARVFPGPIVTQLLPMKAFYRAGDYHQNYYGGKPDRDRPVARRSQSRRLRQPGSMMMKAKAGAPSSTGSSGQVENVKTSPAAANRSSRTQSSDKAKPEPR